MATTDRDAVYDRQVRLWGAEAQRRLSAARVLVVGNAASGLGAELVKDLALAGLNVSLRDPSPVEAEDVRFNVFLRPTDVATPLKRRDEAMLPRVEELNPLASPTVAKLASDPAPAPPTRVLSEAAPDATLVVLVAPPAAASSPSPSPSFADAVCEWDDACAQRNVPLIVCDARGLAGYALLSVGANHTYVSPPDTTPKTASYPRLRDALAWDVSKAPTNKRKRVHHGFLALRCLADKSPRAPSSFLAEGGGAGDAFPPETVARADAWFTAISRREEQYAPVCTIVGGLVGNEVIKIVSGIDLPADNVLVFDGLDGGALVKRFPL